MSDRERTARLVGLAVLALNVALFMLGVLGIALLIAGIVSWMHPGDVASAWARTLGGVGLIGGSAGLAAVGWLAAERLAKRGETALHRAAKFMAVIGILLALVCLPFAAAIRTTTHGPWLGWGETPGRRCILRGVREPRPARRGPDLLSGPEESP